MSPLTIIPGVVEPSEEEVSVPSSPPLASAEEKPALLLPPLPVTVASAAEEVEGGSKLDAGVVEAPPREDEKREPLPAEVPVVEALGKLDDVEGDGFRVFPDSTPLLLFPAPEGVEVPVVAETPAVVRLLQLSFPPTPTEERNALVAEQAAAPAAVEAASSAVEGLDCCRDV